MILSQRISPSPPSLECDNAVPRNPHLWADRHNSPLLSLREGSARHCASGVNLLTFGAIRGARAGLQQLRLPYVVFRPRPATANLHGGEESQQNNAVRNPDEWSPEEPDGQSGPEPPATRRGALLGLIFVLLLVAGGLALTHILRGMAQLQDCALSGRSNCS